ncbi:MAG TPA: hypothetical protein VFX64_05855 [Candidatus Nitrosotalea sp.]|nr:hypothetical protein [Candidatus Nitrosotalea sp.]
MVQPIEKQIEIPINKCTQNQTFGPGQIRLFTGGPIEPIVTRTTNVKGDGFSKTETIQMENYNITQFILQPGHQATIRYSIHVNSDNFNLGKFGWISNNAGFLHRTKDTLVSQTASYIGNVTIDNVTKQMWNICIHSPNGETCSPQYAKPLETSVPFQTIVSDHKGVSVTYSPPFELVSVIPVPITATISADENASQGTYWLDLHPDQTKAGRQTSR